MVCFTLLIQNYYRDWFGFDNQFFQDVDQYYSYCIMAWVKNDLSFNNPVSVERGYWLVTTEKGKIQRFTMGMAIMYSPFFLIAHFFSQAFNLPCTGYTPIYSFFISLGTLFYVFIGLFFLRKALLYYFSEKVVAVTLFSLYLCTNLFYYTVGYGELSHSYLFSLLSIYVYFSIQWVKTFRDRYLYIVAFILGFSTLIRPIEILNFLFVFLLFALTDYQEMINKLRQGYLKILLSIFIFLLPFLLQMIYWRVYAGNWLIYTYQREGFFWSDPKVLELLFSYRNGAVVYSPILLFGFLGFLFLYKMNKKIFFSCLITLMVALYVVSCWWTWWYGGGYGNRALVEYYVYVSFGLSAFYSFTFEKINGLKNRAFRWLTNGVLVALLAIFFINNLVRHYQKIIGVLHWDSMTKEAYWYLGWKVRFDINDRIKLDSLYVHPDYEEAVKGNRDQ
ncbi:MAG: hypothetical protein Fur0023_08380 [Bacteroidia bacterium]